MLPQAPGYPSPVPSVLLVRHALSAWNAAGRWQGQADPPLAPSGRQQAVRAAGAVGPVDLVVTSDLDRARTTGALLAPGAPVVELPELREYGVGEWSGLTRAEIERRWPDQIARFDAGRLDHPPGGEPRADFERRVRRAAHLVVGAAASRTLVVTHGGVIRTLARLQLGVDRHVSQLAGYRAQVKGDSLVLTSPLDLLGPARPDDQAVETVLL